MWDVLLGFRVCGIFAGFLFVGYFPGVLWLLDVLLGELLGCLSGGFMSRCFPGMLYLKGTDMGSVQFLPKKLNPLINLPFLPRYQGCESKHKI